MNRTTISSVVALFIISACAAPETGRVNVVDTAGAASTAAHETSGGYDVTPQLDEILDRIEVKSDTIETLQADIRYDRIQGLLGDEQRRFGSLVYQAGPPAQFAVRFDRLVIDNTVRKQDRAYVFDGHWLTEKLDDQKVYIRRQLVDDDEAADPIKLGEGPFALPLNHKKQEVLNRFDVQLADESDDDDLPGCYHLLLFPHEELDIKPTRIELWYDRETLLPRRAMTIDERDESQSVVDILKLRENVRVNASIFSIPPPDGHDWVVEEKPLSKEAE